MTLWASELLSAAPRLRHAFSGAGANMCTARGPGAAAAPMRRTALCDHLGVSVDQLTYGEQVHGAEIVLVGEGAAGNGHAAPGARVPHVDGLVTNVPGVPLMALSADCPAVLVYHPPQLPSEKTQPRSCTPNCQPRAVLGIAHAGWRGSVAGIVGRLIDVMIEHYGCDRTCLLAGISPSAGPCCYEVKEDVIRLAALRWPQHAAYLTARGGRTYLDLWAVLAAQLAAGGIDAARQSIARHCTICDERFFSYRRDGPQTGHAALIAAIAEESPAGQTH
jgi:hypothetical protein